MNRFLLLLVFTLAIATLCFGQQAKSDEEFNAAMAVQNATDANARIAAAENLLIEFKDTEFREFANLMLMASYQELDDLENMIIYAEETLNINPNNVGVLLELAYAIPSRTRQFDLDKEEKLSSAEGYAAKALALVPNMTNPNPDVPNDQWLTIKKDYMSRGNESLGVVESKRENYDGAVAFLQKAIALAPDPMPMTHYHYADALLSAGKREEALAAINQSITLGGIPLGGGADAAKELKAFIVSGMAVFTRVGPMCECPLQKLDVAETVAHQLFELFDRGRHFVFYAKRRPRSRAAFHPV
jgi:tetratricopeptide (TPR) repeat protein